MRLINNGVNYFTLTKNTTDSDKEATLAPQKEIVSNDEELLKDIKKYMKDTGYISISRIQAEFAIGYPKASKIMRQLIDEGLVEINADGGYLVKK